MKSRTYLWIWLFLACCITHLLFLLLVAMRMGPHESSENNGYGNIFSLPFIGILGVVALIIACLYPRHAPTNSGTVKLLMFIGLYAVAATVTYNLPVLYGGYTASFKLVDNHGDPISGMRAEFIQQRAYPSIVSLFFVQDYATVDYSDKQGIVRAPANTNTRLNAFINLADDNSTPVNPGYFIGDLLLVEQTNMPSFTVSVMPSWDEQQDGERVSSRVAIPFRDPISITIPGRSRVSTHSAR